VDESKSVASAAMTRGRIGQIFGGQLAAHSMTVGAAAVPDALAAHSLHLVFLAAGDAGERVCFKRSIVKQWRKGLNCGSVTNRHSRTSSNTSSLALVIGRSSVGFR